MKKTAFYMICASFIVGMASLSDVTSVKESGKCNNIILRNTENKKENGTVVLQGKCGENVYWKIENDQMTVSGTGEITSSPWKDKDSRWEVLPKKLVIESGITSICDGAFAGYFIEEDMAEEGWDSDDIEQMFDDDDFYKFSKEDLFKDGIVLPDTLKKIGKQAFRSNGITKIQIPNSVESIGEKAFKNCEYLKEVTLSEKIRKIELQTFYGCTDLNKINLGMPIESVGNQAFSKCRSLEEISFPVSVTKIGDGVFSECDSLKQFSIPAGIKTVSKSMFQQCTSLKSVGIPASVTSIEKLAFGGCNRLENVSIPSGVTKIGEAAFEYCASLKKLRIPKKAKIAKKVFKDCYSLKSIHLPSNMQEIPEKLLSGCASLKSFSFPAKVKKIGKEALAGCDSLKKVVIPAKVKKIEAFDQDCPKLKKIVNKSKKEYSLSTSKLVKTWYQGKEKVTKVKPGKTVTAKCKKFKIKYNLKVDGKKVKVKGKLPKSYQYGKSVKFSKKITLNKAKEGENAFVGWRYGASGSKYRHGRERTYEDSYVYKTAAGTKGNLTVRPVVAQIVGETDKNHEHKIKFMVNVKNSSTPSNMYEMIGKEKDYSYDKGEDIELRYSTDAKMTNAVKVYEKYHYTSCDEYYEADGEKGKSYYVQVRLNQNGYPGVLVNDSWSKPVKITID